LFKNQYGFRKGHSTSLALHHLFDNITKAIDQKEYTIAVFIDLSNAFDMVNHEILINKLKHYGIRGLSLDWIKSYFGNRQQYVE
jgi:retron-type reverse transcriptase